MFLLPSTPLPPQLCFVNDPICDTTMYWFGLLWRRFFYFRHIRELPDRFFLESIGSSSNIEELQVEYDPG